MNVRSWLSSTCTTTSSTETTSYSQHSVVSSETNSVVSDTTTTTNSSSSSLQSGLSLQTLPSVPSLQHSLSLLETLTLSLSSPPLAVASLPGGLPITSLAVHGNLLYSAAGHIITVYDRGADGYPVVDEFSHSSGSIKAVAFCGGRILTAHQDSRIRVWKSTPAKSRPTRHRLRTALPTVGDRLRRCSLPKNYIAVRRHKKQLWIQHADAVTGLAVDPAGTTIYSVSWDRSLKIWRASDLRCVESVNKAHDDAINAVAVSANRTVYTGSADCRIRVWARPEGEERRRPHALVATLEKHKSAVNALALTADGSVLFSGSCDRSILVWEREDSACHMAVSGALRGHRGAVLSLHYVSDLLVSGSADRTVRIWQRGVDGKYLCLSVLEGHARPVKSVLAVAEGNGCGGGGTGESDSNGVVTVFSGGLDGETKVWQVSVSRHRKLMK